MVWMMAAALFSICCLNRLKDRKNMTFLGWMMMWSLGMCVMMVYPDSCLVALVAVGEYILKTVKGYNCRDFSRSLLRQDCLNIGEFK